MKRAAWVLVAVLLVPTGSWAQDPAKDQAKDQDREEATEARGAPKIQKIQDVEYGFWLRWSIGASFAIGDFFNYDDGSGSSPAWPPGPIMGLEAGFDLGTIASLHLAISGVEISGTRKTARGVVGNDAGVLQMMVGARVALMTTKRLAWFLKAGAGYLLAFPSVAKVDNGPVFLAGTGLEYATSLRHFFVGLEAGAQFFLGDSFSFSGVTAIVTPTLKYTF